VGVVPLEEAAQHEVEADGVAQVRRVAAALEDDELGGDMPEEVEADRAIQSVMGGVAALLREGMSTGQFRAANVPHLLLSLVGQIIFPFASGDFGKEILGRDVYDPAEVKRRKQELRDFIRFGLVARTST